MTNIGESAYDWDDADEIEGIKKKNQEASTIRANAYAHVFGSDLGQKVLSEWISEYCTGGIPGPSATEREASMRDGKQELIAMIIAQIKKAHGE